MDLDRAEKGYEERDGEVHDNAVVDGEDHEFFSAGAGNHRQGSVCSGAAIIARITLMTL